MTTMPQGRTRRTYFANENQTNFQVLPDPPENHLLTELMLSLRASTQTHLLRDYGLGKFKKVTLSLKWPHQPFRSTFPYFFPEDLAIPEHIQPTIQRFF